MLWPNRGTISSAKTLDHLVSCHYKMRCPDPHFHHIYVSQCLTTQKPCSIHSPRKIWLASSKFFSHPCKGMQTQNIKICHICTAPIWPGPVAFFTAAGSALEDLAELPPLLPTSETNSRIQNGNPSCAPKAHRSPTCNRQDRNPMNLKLPHCSTMPWDTLG